MKDKDRNPRYSYEYPLFIKPQQFRGLLGTFVEEKAQALRDAYAEEQAIRGKWNSEEEQRRRRKDGYEKQLLDLAEFEAKKAAAWRKIRLAKTALISARLRALESQEKF